MEPLDQSSTPKKTRLRIIRFSAAFIVLNFLAGMTVFGIGLIQHYLNIRYGDREGIEWNEHGYPFTYYAEATFDPNGFQGASLVNFLLDHLIFFLAFSSIFLSYRRFIRSSAST